MSKPSDLSRRPTWGLGAVIPNTPYVVLGELGHGGMSRVYEVQDRTTGFVYAFKVLLTDLADFPELVERALREAEFLHLIKGAPHIVTVIEQGRLPDEHRRPYLVMERLYGETLSALLARQALPLTDVLSYIRQVLWGVAAVHGAGVVHRDIKTSNIFVRRDGICTLLDFSIMKALREIGLPPAQFHTNEGEHIGTPLYMAPEQARCEQVDQRADIFSVGLVLAECLLGRRLLAHLGEQAYRYHLTTEGVPSLELVGGEHLPLEVRQLVRHATRFDPAARIPDALAFLFEINRIAELLGLRLRPIPPGVPRAPDASAPPAAGHHAAPTPSGYDSNAPTPRLHRASPSGRAAPSGAAAGPSTPLTSSALPTPVDSVSPTRVKAPSPPSSPAWTPPLRSERRKTLAFLLGRAQKMPSPQGKRGEPPPTLPLPPRWAGGFSGAPKFHDRLILRPGMLSAPVNNVLDGSAPVEGQPAFEPSSEAQLAREPSAEAPREGALPNAARPPLGPIVAIVGAGVAVSIAASLAVVWWAGPPAAVVRVSSEPHQAPPAGVVAPAPSAPEAPPHEPPAEAKPSEAPPAEPARHSEASASKADTSERARLEARLKSKKGNLADAFRFLDLCQGEGDRTCLRQAREFIEDLASKPR
jgi:eukaryotic-like serine/threonine-protein kinase